MSFLQWAETVFFIIFFYITPFVLNLCWTYLPYKKRAEQIRHCILDCNLKGKWVKW